MSSAYGQVLRTMGGEVARLSAWIDAANVHRDPEALTWGRMAKLAEETGEVISEMILHTGQNPRKPQQDQHDTLIKENLDVAITALGNVEHLNGNDGSSLILLLVHLSSTIARAERNGMAPTLSPDDEILERLDFE